MLTSSQSVSSTFTKISNTRADFQCRAELDAKCCHEVIFSEKCERRSINLLTTELISIHCTAWEWVDKLKHINHLRNHTELFYHSNYTKLLQNGLLEWGWVQISGLVDNLYVRITSANASRFISLTGKRIWWCPR